MADHLIKEQRGTGEEYRRSTLQKFTNLVNKENDFPLSKFHSRYDGASEAIGYGKALMLWQMLRRKLGDDVFLKGMRLFYKDNIFKTASYDDIRIAMETASDIDLSDFFKQWVYRTGAPELTLSSLKTDRYNNKYRIFLTLEQKQSDSAFTIDVPVNIATDKGLKTFVLNMNKKIQNYQLILDDKPLKLALDPQYDVFRILNPSEVPPALSKIWGSKDNLIILPANVDQTKKNLYQKFANEWKKADNDNFTIEFDTNIKKISEDKTVWILGFENKFASDINKELKFYNSGFSSDSVYFENKKLPKKGSNFILTLFDKNNYNKQHIFIACDNEKAIPGLIRKLPHYGKYGYLAFTGNEPTNISKGQWSVLNSPLVKTFEKGSEKLSVKEKRTALAELKAVFSENKMMKIIKYLSSDEMKGRGLGTPESKKVANYIASEYKKAGLIPLFNGNYFQNFTHDFKAKRTLKITNVAGIIPGTDPVLKNYPIVVSAHYDHLGFGWPDVHKGNEGKIHHGADDNASGVAILLELARTMAKSAKPKRTIIFLASDGEEAGLIGSRYFVEHKTEYIKEDFFANINLDTDGSLFDKKLLVLNGNSAREWKFIFMGTDYTTGIRSEVINQELDASDQIAFIEKGIPAIQLFTGATPNYHRPTDTFEKIDGKGLVKVATVSKEVIEYLGDREEPMHFTGKSNKANTNENPIQQNAKNRRVSTGSVPDFTYTGKGVKIGSIIENSAGEKAGLKTGDVIISLNNKKIENLKQYSDYLKEFKPEDIINLTVLRNGKQINIKLKLAER
jgi:aminopeptidase N